MNRIPPYGVRWVSEQLGIPRRTAQNWLRRRWLRGRRVPFLGRLTWRTSHDDLLDFMTDQRHWHRWETSRVKDLAMREWAMELRADERWLSLPEIARRYHVHLGTAWLWVHNDRLPSRRLTGRPGGGTRWFVRERDLEHFRPPIDVPWRNQPLTQDDRNTIIRLYKDGHGTAEVARQVGRSRATVEKIWQQSRKSRPKRLTPEQARSLLADAATGRYSGAELARHYGISPQAVAWRLKHARQRAQQQGEAA